MPRSVSVCPPRRGWLSPRLPLCKTTLRPTYGCAVGDKPEDGKLRFRNHAPQEVFMFNGLRRQVPEEIALHGVLELALVARRFQPGRRRKREGT